MLHRLKGGGFRLRLKAGSVRRSADIAANSRDIEVVVGLGRNLVLDVFDPHVVRHIAAAHYRSPSPTDAGPSNACAVRRTHSAACANCGPSSVAPLATPTGSGTRQQHVDMVAIDRPLACTTISCARAVSRTVPGASPNVTAKHRVTILRHPDQVVLAVPNGMAATLIRFHPRQSTPEAPPSSRLKAWGFRIPYRGL